MKILMIFVFLVWIASMFISGLGSYRADRLLEGEVRFDQGLYDSAGAMAATGIISSTVLLAAIMLLNLRVKSKVMNMLLMLLPIAALFVIYFSQDFANKHGTSDDVKLLQSMATAVTMPYVILILPIIVLIGSVIGAVSGSLKFLFGRR